MKKPLCIPFFQHDQSTHRADLHALGAGIADLMIDTGHEVGRGDDSRGVELGYASQGPAAAAAAGTGIVSEPSALLVKHPGDQAFLLRPPLYLQHVLSAGLLHLSPPDQLRSPGTHGRAYLQGLAASLSR